MFFKFVDHDERMRLGVLLEDDDGASELIKNQGEVIRTCQAATIQQAEEEYIIKAFMDKLRQPGSKF